MRKKWIYALLAACLFVFCACSPGTQQEELGMPSDRFETMEMVTPFWLSDTMYNESVMLVEEDEQPASGVIAFTPTSQIVVRDSTLTKTYKEGVDYTFDPQTRTITRLEGSEIPYITRSSLYAGQGALPEGFNAFPGAGGGPTLVYSETPYYFQHQIFVTYEFDNSEMDRSIVSEYINGALPNTLQSLKNKETITMAVLGDSISEGANSSDFLNVESYNLSYSELIRSFFEENFNTDVQYVNKSVGGQTSAYAATAARQALTDNPDLIILAFGMNDTTTGTSDTQYKNNIKSAMDILLEQNPDCEFILVAPMLANPESAAGGMQERFAALLEEVADGYRENSVVTVAMQPLHEYLLENRGKKFIDMSANNINHPNDFFMRLYAMNIVAAFWDF